MTFSDGRRTKTPSLPTPARIGRYEILQRLATGGMAEVFIAREHQARGVERLVVVKRILPHLAMHDAFVDMFVAEARFVMRIQHPNVVQVYQLSDADDDDAGGPYLAMEYIAGVSLRDLLIMTYGPPITRLDLGTGIALMSQACAGAHAAHELVDVDGSPLGLVHRDISPHNLMVTGDGHVKLLDFGIAKATHALSDDNTRTGALKGKLAYMAPEQINQRDVDRRADVFALAAVAFELFAHERLFRRDSDLQTMQAITTGEFKNLRTLRPDLPTMLADVLEQALHPDRNQRTASADVLRRSLLQVAEQAGVKADVDAAQAVLQPLLGQRLADRTTSFLQAIPARGSASGSRSFASHTGGLSSKEPDDKATAVDVPRRLTPTPTPTAMKDHTVVESSLPSGRPLRSRGTWAAIAVTMLSFAAVLAVWQWWRSTPTGPRITMVVAPTADPQHMRADIDQLSDVLQQKIHRPMTIIIASSYDDAVAALADGRAAFGILPPSLFVRARDRTPDIEALATKMIDGSGGSDGVILVREDSPVTSLAQLKGSTFCHPDQRSTTGTLLARAALRAAGLDPNVDIKPRFSGNHTQVLIDLMHGDCDAAGTYSGGYLAADRAGIPVSRTRTLAISGRSPQDVVVAAPTATPSDRTLMQQALLAIDPKKDVGSEVLGTMERISGFTSPRIAEYDALLPAYRADGQL